jgi:hypothetical protein
MTGRPARRDKSRPVRLSPKGRGAERSQQPLQGKSDDTHCATSLRATELRGVRNRSFRSGQSDCKSCAPHTAEREHNNDHMSDQL